MVGAGVVVRPDDREGARAAGSRPGLKVYLEDLDQNRGAADERDVMAVRARPGPHHSATRLDDDIRQIEIVVSHVHRTRCWRRGCDLGERDRGLVAGEARADRLDRRGPERIGGGGDAARVGSALLRIYRATASARRYGPRHYDAGDRPAARVYCRHA